MLAVSLAGVNNLIAGAFEELGSGAVEALMGAPPEEAGDRYTLASPTERLPIGVDQVVVHGLRRRDRAAPPEHRLRRQGEGGGRRPWSSSPSRAPTTST